jgi:(p)ppGpp synthase/HD superfamily hydrolase
MPAYSERYEAALILTARAHRTQDRKVGGVPYVVHPFHVSVILIRYGFSEDVAIAGLLHDAVEDQDVPLDGIEAQFGPAVAGMVAALSEQKREAGVERPWEIRKQEALAEVRQASLDTVAIKAADALHSTRSLASDLRHVGPSIWENFSRGPKETFWYYQSIATIVGQRLGNHPLAAELDAAIQDFARAIDETGAL